MKRQPSSRALALGALVAGALALAPGIARAAELDCHIEPHVIVTLAMAGEGIIESVAVERGDVVTQGQVVARLESSLETATVAVNRARSELTNKRLGELELQRAVAELGQRVLRSPVNGVVVERLMSRGEFAKQSPIVKIAQLDPLRVEVFAPVPMLGKIRVGMRGQVMPAAPIGGSHPARVAIVDRVVDTASSTFGVRLELPNPGQRLPAGLKCKVRIPFDE